MSDEVPRKPTYRAQKREQNQGRIFHRFDPRNVESAATSSNAELKAARALEVFNASEHIQTIAGVARSLGSPNVCAHPREKSSIVAIIVAWELSWYCFEVDLGNESAGVRLAARGYDPAELDESDQRDNVATDEWGHLRLVGAVA